jgi:RNA polymerase sigma factor (sigma-70 family)
MDEDAITIPPLLLEAACRGDEFASADLVTAIYPLIGRCVRNQIRRRDDVEDVVQEVVLKVLLKLHQYHGPQPFTHWVSRLAITTSYDWLRKQRSRPAVTASDLSEPERELLERTLPSAEAEVDSTHHDLLLGLLDKLISTLHPREQIVIRMLDLEERSVREIAQLTGWSESKIKVTAHRSRRKLGERLKQLEAGG